MARNPNPNYPTIADGAKYFNKHPRSIELWLRNGFVAGYRDDDGKIRVSIAEIENALRTNPRMRDGRRPFGPKARIVPMPVLHDEAADA